MAIACTYVMALCIPLDCYKNRLPLLRSLSVLSGCPAHNRYPQAADLRSKHTPDLYDHSQSAPSTPSAPVITCRARLQDPLGCCGTLHAGAMIAYHHPAKWRVRHHAALWRHPAWRHLV